MKSRTMEPLALRAFAQALEAKRTADATAATAKKAVEAIKASLALEHADYILRASDGSMEILASFNRREVRAIDARTDMFHSFKVVQK